MLGSFFNEKHTVNGLFRVLSLIEMHLHIRKGLNPKTTSPGAELGYSLMVPSNDRNVPMSASRAVTDCFLLFW
jgi:hypothetical protein